MRTLNVEKPKRSSLLPLVALLPINWRGWSSPCPFYLFTLFSFLFYCLLLLSDRDIKNVCNAWKILFFSGDIIDQLCKKMQMIVMPVFLKSCFPFFNGIQVNSDPGWVNVTVTALNSWTHRAGGVSVKHQHCWWSLRVSSHRNNSNHSGTGICWVEQRPQISELSKKQAQWASSVPFVLMMLHCITITKYPTEHWMCFIGTVSLSTPFDLLHLLLCSDVTFPVDE